MKENMINLLMNLYNLKIQIVKKQMVNGMDVNYYKIVEIIMNISEIIIK